MEPKFCTVLSIWLSLFVLSGCGKAVKPSLVPLPQKTEPRKASFQLNSETRIIVDAACEESGKYLAIELGRLGGRVLPVQQGIVNGNPKGVIELTMRNNKSALGPEGYELSVSPDLAVIRGEPAGVFYGVQSLLQLLLVQSSNSRPALAKGAEIPCINIDDQPRFRWRGLIDRKSVV